MGIDGAFEGSAKGLSSGGAVDEARLDGGDEVELCVYLWPKTFEVFSQSGASSTCSTSDAKGSLSKRPNDAVGCGVMGPLLGSGFSSCRFLGGSGSANGFISALLFSKFESFMTPGKR